MRRVIERALLPASLATLLGASTLQQGQMEMASSTASSSVQSSTSAGGLEVPATLTGQWIHDRRSLRLRIGGSNPLAGTSTLSGAADLPATLARSRSLCLGDRHTLTTPTADKVVGQLLVRLRAVRGARRRDIGVIAVQYYAYTQASDIRYETSARQEVRVPRYFRHGRIRLRVSSSLDEPARHERHEVITLTRGTCRANDD